MRRSLSAVLVVGLLSGSGVVSAAPADPAYPSAEWAAREAANFAKVAEAPAEQVDPAFQQRWNEQSVANRNEQVARDNADPNWNSRGNACASWGGPCTGDPYRYPGVDPFYANEGDVVAVNFYDKEGARLSGRVWAPKGSAAGAGLPGVVIITGSVQAPETLYWWMAQDLVRAGYAVLTFDVRGQGRSDNRTRDGQSGTNINSAVFATNLIDAIDFFRSSPARPYPHNARFPEVATTPSNPIWDRLDPERLGIVGHSLGATGVSVVQGIADWPGAMDAANPVDVAVAWDNVSATGSLAGHTVEPRVPMMGQSGDYYLAPTPYTSPPDPQSKKLGFNRWRDAGIPAYQLQIRGGSHYEWSLLPGFPTSSWDWGNPLANHYTLAWLDRWLKLDGEAGYRDADARLLADGDWRDRLSFYFPSARAFPDRRGVWWRCEDMLREDCPAGDGLPFGWGGAARRR